MCIGVTYRPLAVEECCAAASRNGPVAEVEHVVDLLGELGGILMVGHKSHTAFFGHTLEKSDIIPVKTEQSCNYFKSLE